MSEIRFEMDGGDPSKEKKEKKDKKEKKEKKKKSGSRINRISIRVRGAGSDDNEATNPDEEEKEEGDGDNDAEEGEGIANSGSVPTKARLTLAQVKDRTLTGAARRKRSATEGATAGSLLGSIRGRGSKLKKKESSDGAEEAEAEAAQDDGHGEVEVKKKEKKRSLSRRQKKDEIKTLPSSSGNNKTRAQASEGSGNGEYDGSDEEREEATSSSSATDEKRAQLKRSGSMVELKKQQSNTIDRGQMNARTLSRDAAAPTARDGPALERFVSLKNISMNLTSMFGNEGGRQFDKSPRRVSSNPESLSQSSGKTLNPLWVLNQKAKIEGEEREKRERQEQRKREREILPVGDDIPEKQRQRNRVINEIVSTERDYVEDLKIMISHFRSPLEEEGILVKEELTTIFSNLTLLLQVNSELLVDISQKVKDSEGDDLGQSFFLLADYLKMYSQYCSNQAAAREAVANASKTNARFRAFQERMAVHPDLNGLTLRDYLIKPVQRLCKYPLLMRELIKHTDETHPDYQKLKEAFDKIENVVTLVNEKKQADEDREAVARIISRLSNADKFGVQLMVPGRSLVQEGKLFEFLSDRSEPLRRHYFLFSDLLILAEDKEPKSSSRRKEPTWKVSSMTPFTQASMRDMNSSDSHLIEISCSKPQHTVTLFFETESEKDEWMTNLQGKLQKVHPPSRTASSSQFEDLGAVPALERIRAPSPPSGPASFPATAFSPSS